MYRWFCDLLFRWFVSPGAYAAARGEGYRHGIEEGRAAGESLGFIAGQEKGLEEGRKLGRQQGRADGIREAGYEVGYAEGLDAGYAAGLRCGTEEAREQGRAAGYRDGEQAGRAAGFAAGRQAGYAAGVEAGVAEGRQTGTEEVEAQARQEGLDAGIALGLSQVKGHPFDSVLQLMLERLGLDGDGHVRAAKQFTERALYNSEEVLSNLHIPNVYRTCLKRGRKQILGWTVRIVVSNVRQTMWFPDHKGADLKRQAMPSLFQALAARNRLAGHTHIAHFYRRFNDTDRRPENEPIVAPLNHAALFAQFLLRHIGGDAVDPKVFGDDVMRDAPPHAIPLSGIGWPVLFQGEPIAKKLEDMLEFLGLGTVAYPRTVNDVLLLSAADLDTAPNVGEATIRGFQQVLAVHGLHLWGATIATFPQPISPTNHDTSHAVPDDTRRMLRAINLG